MEVELSKLQVVCESIFAHLQKSGVDTIDIPMDYYWFIPEDESYNPYQNPSTFTLGQLSDDWFELLEIAEGKRPPIGYHLVWLAAVLKAVGEQVKL